MLGKATSVEASKATLQTSASAELVAARHRGESLRQRQRLFLLMNEPASSTSALWLGRTIYIMLLIYALSATSDHPHGDGDRIMGWDSAHRPMFSVPTSPTPRHAPHLPLRLRARVAHSMETVAWITMRTGGGPWVMIQFILNALFTFEALLRLVSFEPSLRAALRDPFVLLDLCTCIPFWVRLALHPDSLEADNYLRINEVPQAVRIFEALASLRLLKLCRYYDGATLLARAVSRSLQQLGVPFFMLAIMLFCFAAIMFEIEWDPEVEQCMQLWMDEGVERDFLVSRPDGVTWRCDVCPTGDGAASANMSTLMSACARASCHVQAQLCVTCRGFPMGHSECAGKPFVQRFPDVPRTIWFMMVTVTVRATSARHH